MGIGVGDLGLEDGGWELGIRAEDFRILCLVFSVQDSDPFKTWSYT